MTQDMKRGGDIALISGAAIGLALSLFNYFWPANGIHGTPGVLLVIVSTALIFAAAVVTAIDSTRRHWWTIVLNVLIPLGILGTGFAAYLLETDLLLVLMGLAAVGWLLRIIALPQDRSGEIHTVSGAVR